MSYHISNPTYHDLERFYYYMEAENLTEVVFYDGSVTNIHNFMRCMSSCVAIMSKNIVYDQHGQIIKDEILGMIWFNDFIGATAQLHICFLKSDVDKIAMGNEMLKYTFGFMPTLQSIYGKTPKPYRHVIKQLLGVGGEIIGKIKGGCELYYKNRRITDVTISQILAKDKV